MAPPNLAANVEKVVMLVRKYTYPILFEGEDGIPDLVASCLFIQIDGQDYLVTAAHAVRNKSRGMLTSGCEELVGVSGRASSTSGERDDHIDVAVISVSGQFVSRNCINVVPEAWLKPYYDVEYPHIRAISGYPASKNKRIRAVDRHTQTVTNYYFGYVGYAQPELDFAKYGMFEDDNVCIRYEVGSNGEQKGLNPPSPIGMSGGPCWLVPDAQDPEGVYLEGTLIEFRDKRIVFATKIERVIELIMESYNKAMESDA